MPGKTISGQSREFVLNLLEYFEKEKENNGPLIPFSSVRERVADALKISLSSVTRIAKEKRFELPITTPGQSHNKPKKKTDDVPDTITAEIKNVIYEMKAKGQHMTIKILNEELKNKFLYNASDTSLWRLLKRCGFSYKIENSRRILCEKPNVVSKRLHFLRHYIRNLESRSPLQCIFLDETWIFSRGSFKKSWQDETVKSCKKGHTNTGKRFIVLHAGSKDGFLEDAGLLFSTKSKNADYHDSMDKDSFEKWVSERLIPTLEEPSLIIMDNASYHSSLKDKVPNSSWSKPQLREWLATRNINFDEDALKIELLNLCYLNKPPNPTYVIDELLHENGHQVLRLPPYHCQYNPIELVWGICKQYYDRHIGENGYGDEQVLKVWHDALGEVTPAVWADCVKHTEDLIRKDWNNQVRYDTEEIKIIADLRESSDEEDWLVEDDDFV